MHLSAEILWLKMKNESLLNTAIFYLLSILSLYDGDKNTYERVRNERPLLNAFRTGSERILIRSSVSHAFFGRSSRPGQARTSRKKDPDKNFKKKRIRQESKNTRVLSEVAVLASPAKIRSTRFLLDSQDLFLQARILYRRNEKRILLEK